MARLLVVDDELNVLYSIEKTLQSDTLEVDVAQTGEEAIDLVWQLRPDAVVLDVRLSDMSGLDVFEQLRQIDPRLPVVFITAFAATETASPANPWAGTRAARASVAASASRKASIGMGPLPLQHDVRSMEFSGRTGCSRRSCPRSPLLSPLDAARIARSARSRRPACPGRR